MAEKVTEKTFVGTIDLTPDYAVLTEDFAHRLSLHGFSYGVLDPVISLIEMVRFLDRRDGELPLEEQAVEQILLRLRTEAAKSKGQRAS